MPGAAGPPPQGAIPGAPSPERIAKARQIAAAFDAAGLTVPADIAETAKFPLVGPTAQATAAGTAAGQFPYQQALEQQKAQWQVWAEQQKPQTVRPGSYVKNPYTGQTEYNPEIVRTTDPKTGQQWQWYSYPPSTPDGVPRYVSIGPGEQGARTKAQETAGGTAAGQNEPLPPPPAPPGSPPRPTYQGTQLAPGMMSKQPDYPEPAYTSTQLEANQKRWGEQNGAMATTLGGAQQAEQRLTTMANVYQMIDTGRWATDKAEFNMALTSLFGQSAPRLFNTGDPAQVMVAMHELYKATLQNLSAVNKKFTGQEFVINTDKGENPNLPAGANLQMLSEDIGQLRQLQGLTHDWTEARIAGRQDPDIYTTKWLRENPLPPIVDAVKKEIGIGKLAPPPPDQGGGGHPAGGYVLDPRTNRIVPRPTPGAQ